VGGDGDALDGDYVGVCVEAVGDGVDVERVGGGTLGLWGGRGRGGVCGGLRGSGCLVGR
jgi:hypothetical protein